MPDWVGIGLIILVIAVLFWFMYWLLRNVQEGDASKRGEDSSEPYDFVPDDNPGGDGGHD